MTVGFAFTGSFCTFRAAMEALRSVKETFGSAVPVFSEHAATMDTRFGKAADFVREAEEICGVPAITTIAQAEPIGPKKLFDALVICPCTGNTMAKIAGGVNDTAVTMAAKSQLRNGRPVILAPSTNDGLSGSAANLGLLLNRRHIYIVPFRQDDPEKKPRSLTADLTLLCETISAAMEGRQLQPIVRG
ncbi:MAG: dipicolinate synthase subunit B [Oscillospiraceae bacterium]|nr:dipicolinate synthase subunit B [Oscillospiraceae bacterium]